MHFTKYPININEVNICEIDVSKKVLYGKGFNYFIGFKGDDKVRSSCIMLLKMIGYVKCFDETKCMLFLIEDEELLKVCNKDVDKISN